MIVIIIYFCKVPLIVKSHSADYICVCVGINQSPLQGMWQPFCISNAAQKHFRGELKNSFSKRARRKRMLYGENHPRHTYEHLSLQTGGSVIFCFPNAKAVPGQGFVWALKNTQAKRKPQGAKETNKYMHIREVRAQQPTHTVTVSPTPVDPLFSATTEPPTKPCLDKTWGHHRCPPTQRTQLDGISEQRGDPTCEKVPSTHAKAATPPASHASPCRSAVLGFTQP